MEGPNRSKSVPSRDDNNTGSSLPKARIKCKLCGTPVPSTKAGSGTSRDEAEFTASLEWLHGFLVRFNCLEEGDEGLLNCSATEICGKCKSNLKFAKKNGEEAVQQHEEIKEMYEEFSNKLQNLQGKTGITTLRLQEVLGGPGISQGGLQSAIGKAFNNFKHLQDSTKEVLELLNSRFSQNSGLFPFPNIGDVNWSESQALSDEQDRQEIDPVIKTEHNTETGTQGEESDGNENEQNQIHRITSTFSITRCYVEENIAENERLNSPAVKLETGPSTEGNNQADNQIQEVPLEASDEEGVAAAENNQKASLKTDKSPKRTSQEKGKARKKTASGSSTRVSGSNINDVAIPPVGESNNSENSGTASPRKQKRQSGKKRKLSEGEVSTSSEKENSCDTSSRDVKPVPMTSLPEISSDAAQAPTMPAPAIAGPSKLAPPNQASKKMRISSVEDPSGSGRPKRLSVKTVNVNVASAEPWAEKLNALESRKEENAITLLQILAYLKPENIQQKLLYNLPQSDFNGKRISVQEKVDTAIKCLLKHGFIKIQKMDQKTVLCISPDLQKQVQANLESEGLEWGVLDSLMILLKRLQRQNANGDQVKERNEVVLEENIEHALSIWKCAVYYPEIIRTDSAILCDILEVLEEKKKILQEQGIKLGEIALENFKTTLKPHHQNCIRLEKVISVLLYKTGKYAESAERLEELSKKYENVLKGKNDDDLLLEIKVAQGESLLKLGRYEEALAIQRQVFEKTKEKEGEDDMDTLDEENRYGRFLWNAGKLQEAQEMFKSLEEKERKVNPGNMKRIVELQMHLAGTYSDMGAYDDALNILKGAHRTISSRLEENVELFAEVSYELSNAHLDLDNFAEAMEHLSSDYEKVKSMLGDNNCWTLQILKSLGSAHRGRGRDQNGLETALKMHKVAYQGLLDIDEVEKSISAKNEIALDLSMLGRHGEALQMFKECIDEMQNVRGDPEILMEFKMSYVEALERSEESLQEVLRQYEAIKKELEEAEGTIPRQIKRVAELINRVQEKIQSGNK